MVASKCGLNALLAIVRHHAELSGTSYSQLGSCWAPLREALVLDAVFVSVCSAMTHCFVIAAFAVISFYVQSRASFSCFGSTRATRRAFTCCSGSDRTIIALAAQRH